MRSFLHREASLDRHLPMMNFSLFDVAARFDHLKPAEVLDGFVCPFNGCFNGLLNGISGGAGEFDEFIDGVFHNYGGVGPTSDKNMSIINKTKSNIMFLFYLRRWFAG